MVLLASYIGFTYKSALASGTTKAIVAAIFLLIFASHSFLLSNPRAFGLDVEGDEFPKFTKEMIGVVATMDPVEFSQTDEGRKIAIDVYDTSAFITVDELEKIVEENPVPIQEAQQSLLSIDPLANNPYSYIISIYTYSFIDYLTEE